MQSYLTADIIVDVPSRDTDRPYTYLVPDHLNEHIQIGSRVTIPFGPRKLQGYVIALQKEDSQPQKLKSVVDVLDPLPPLTRELVKLAFFMAESYVCYNITALQAMIPTVLKGRYYKIIKLNKESDHSAADIPKDLLNRLQQGGCKWNKVLLYPNITLALINKWIEAGLITVEHGLDDQVTQKRVAMISGTDKIQTALDNLSSAALKQRKIIEFLLQHRCEISLPELLRNTTATRAQVKSLVEKGYLICEEHETFRDPYLNHNFTRTEQLQLTPAQASLFREIAADLDKGYTKPFLLHGVTGSGKTEIYMQLIARVLEQHKEAIVLVPEISLTPQMVTRFKGRFGSQVAVLHSRLSNGERYDEWRKIRTGKVKIVVGARSAIFAPFIKLGLIIIDEEHESSYKQGENPKYHARDMAIWRARYHDATLILGSATPAAESFYLAKKNVYNHLSLTERVGGRLLPQIEVVDMRHELRSGNRKMFSDSLQKLLKQCIAKREQAILFLNRRGFSSFILCRECGETIRCTHCDISLTYHRTNNTLRCHYCGYTEKIPNSCPACQSHHIRHFGTGTQKVEEELLQTFPGIRVLRMDVDTTSRKGSHERLLSAFEREEADVLVGTQMIAKGLDFPRVSLVGVIAADTMLNLPDYRAAERTFQLLTQVSGRAGRHNIIGKVVVQTYDVDHYSIDLAVQQKGNDFYHQECLNRKQQGYPPYVGLYTILFSHCDRTLLIKYSQRMAEFLQHNLPSACTVLGPVIATIPRINDRFRMQMLIKVPNGYTQLTQVKKCLRELDGMKGNDKEMLVSIDCEGI